MIKRNFYKLIIPFVKIYWFIFRPKTSGSKCLVECKGKFLMIRQTYGNKDYWTLPGGGTDRGEAPENTAQREVQEEVGILLENLQFLGEYESTKQYKRDTIYCFYGQTDSSDFKIDEDEIAEASWFDLENIPRLRSSVVDRTIKMYSEKFI